MEAHASCKDHARDTQLARDSARMESGRPGWRRERRIGTGLHALRMESEMPDGSRREQPARSGCNGKFELGFELLQVLLLLGRLALLHELAKVARILAVESLLQGH